VCYCFEYTKKDIEVEFWNRGQSKVLEKIKAEKKNKDVTAKRKTQKVNDASVMSTRCRKTLK
jgi:hypothetical protein